MKVNLRGASLLKMKQGGLIGVGFHKLRFGIPNLEELIILHLFSTAIWYTKLGIPNLVYQIHIVYETELGSKI